EVRGPKAHFARRRRRPDQGRRPGGRRGVPLLAHPDGARARAPPAAPPRAHPRAQPHVHRGRAPHGGRRGPADRARVAADRPAVRALFPDVALLHVHRADVFGNCQIDGYPHMDADIARAATTVLVTTEEIVGEEETRRRPERTVIPGFVVDALVLAPFGAFPH